MGIIYPLLFQRIIEVRGGFSIKNFSSPKNSLLTHWSREFFLLLLGA